ncbi:MAG: type III pantothenate kinase [Oscillospiraceae bacterium]|nr:type III pantothenate kinase [Oscillospiraceae bacterium]
MLLVIDVGNSNIVFGVYENNRLLNTFRMTTGDSFTSDEIGLRAWTYFQRFGWDANKVEDVIVCSVVPGVMHTLTNAMIKYFNCIPIVVGQNVPSGLEYANNSDYRFQHGADRAVACVGALEKYGAPLIVLDFGTATKVDVMDHNGVYQGGSILAGIQISINALFQKTAKLPQVELAVPQQVLGMRTVEQIQAGTLCGYIGTMEYLISRSKEELGEPEGTVKVVATGGLARLIATNTHFIDVVDSSLILDGLVSIYHKYKNNQQ